MKAMSKPHGAFEPDLTQEMRLDLRRRRISGGRSSKVQGCDPGVDKRPLMPLSVRRSVSAHGALRAATLGRPSAVRPVGRGPVARESEE